jgi:hypothetical protein
MRPPVKFRVLITIFLFNSLLVSAQVRLISPGSIRNDITKIIQDYPNHFSHITGEELVKNPQSTDFRSAVTLEGSEECIVTRYSSSKKEVYSWKASMLTTEDFETARKKFKSLYSQLNNITVHFTGGAPCQFKGSYEDPTEAKKFTSIILSCNPGNESIKNLKIELLMEYELMERKVKILLYERETEDNERKSVD